MVVTNFELLFSFFRPMAWRQIEWAEQAKQLPFRGEITAAEVAKHNAVSDCWIILKGEVYDVTSYLSVHPTGGECLLDFAGGDLTDAFMAQHRYISPGLISKLKIGVLPKCHH
jgi:cytochrome b involved in lipid metabolism